MGEHQHPGVAFVMVEEKRNILVGCVSCSPWASSSIGLTNWCYRLGIFIGFASFFFMEKILRVLGGGEDSHGHSHSHSHSHTTEPTSATASGVESKGNELRSRGAKNSTETDDVTQDAKPSANGPSKLSAYLNLFGDFVHNM